MADKKVASGSENKAVVATENGRYAQGEGVAVKRTPPWPAITIGVFATVVVLAMMVIGWAALAALLHESKGQPGGADMFGRQGYGEYDTRERMRGGMRGDLPAVAARGVVTAINGDTLTVSGGGEQVKVKKSADTTISGDESDVAVNDSVVVLGESEDDGSVTATRIIIRNDSYDSYDSDGPSRRMPNV